MSSEREPPPALRTLPTARLSESDRATLWSLCREAWPEFSDVEWDHMVPGLHFVLDDDGAIVSHAALVERELHVGDRPIRTGFAENVVTRADRRGRGLGTAVMRAVGEHITGRYALGALDTGVPGFYERLGWVRWRGPTFVRTAAGPRATPEEDDAVMILRTPTTPDFALDEPISCEWRPGEVW